MDISPMAQTTLQQCAFCVAPIFHTQGKCQGNGSYKPTLLKHMLIMLTSYQQQYNFIVVAGSQSLQLATLKTLLYKRIV